MKSPKNLFLIAVIISSLLGCNNPTPTVQTFQGDGFSFDVPAGYHAGQLGGEGSIYVNQEAEQTLPEVVVRFVRLVHADEQTRGALIVEQRELTNTAGSKGKVIVYQGSEMMGGGQCPVYMFEKEGGFVEISEYECLKSPIFEQIVQSVRIL